MAAAGFARRGDAGEVALSAAPAAGLGGRVTLSLRGGASAELYLFGAHLVSWSCGGTERLWMSSLSRMDGAAPIRGGVPIAFPQFADQGGLPLHGFARTRVWAVAATELRDGAASATLELGGVGPAAWPHAFRLRYTVTLLAGDALRLELRVANPGPSAFEFTGCFHTYLRVANSRDVALQGLRGCQYTDKVDGMREKREAEPAVRIEAASRASGGFVDRIYKDTPRELVLSNDTSQSRCAISQTGWPDTVVFNPWEEGKKGDKGPDFDDDGYNFTVCVEPAAAAAPVRVAPAAEWVGTQHICCSPAAGRL